MSTVMTRIKSSPLFRYVNIPRRFVYALGYYRQRLSDMIVWLFKSKEYTNFTYDLTERNIADLCDFLAVSLGGSFEEFQAYVAEIQNDTALADHVREMTRHSRFRTVSDEDVKFGRRIGWYAAVRHLKPAVVVETGVEKGLGSLVLCAALLRNRAEGRLGHYYGTDIDASAGWLFTGKYREVGEMLVGDSIESLKRLPVPIDLFINDSDHSADYEAREYETIADKMTSDGIIIGDNAHCTDKLSRFAHRTGLSYCFFREEPARHWYPGGGIGLAFPKRSRGVSVGPRLVRQV